MHSKAFYRYKKPRSISVEGNDSYETVKALFKEDLADSLAGTYYVIAEYPADGSASVPVIVEQIIHKAACN